MKSPFPPTAITSLALITITFTATTDARRGLNADELHLLTRGTDYTFHSICADFKNPDLFFDEWVFVDFLFFFPLEIVLLMVLVGCSAFRVCIARFWCRLIRGLVFFLVFFWFFFESV